MRNVKGIGWGINIGSLQEFQPTVLETQMMKYDLSLKMKKKEITFKVIKFKVIFQKPMGLFKIFSTVDKNEKSQDKHIVGYFSVVVLDGASALGKMEA